VTLERWVAAAVAIGLLVTAVQLGRRRVLAGEPVIDTTTLFMAVWGIALAFFAVPVIDYTTVSLGAWLTIYCSLAAFLVGTWYGRRRFPDRRRPVTEVLSAKRVHLAWLTLGALSLVGFAFFVKAIDAQVGWQALFNDPTAARLSQSNPGFDDDYGFGKALTYLGPIALLLWTVALRASLFTGKWKFAAPAALLILAPYLFTGERLSLLNAILWIALFHLVWRPIRNPRRVAMGTGALLLVGLSFFYVIGARKDATIENHPEIREQLTNEVFDPVALPYLYWTANFPVFSELTQDPLAPTTYGQMSILPITKAAYRVVDESPPVYGAFYEIPFDSYNSATWLGPFYSDFGIVGALLIPAGIGFLATWALQEARRRRTLLTAWLAAVGLETVVFSPLKSQLSDAITWEVIVLAPFVAVFVSPNPRDNLRQATATLAWRLRVRPRTATAIAAAGLLALLAIGIAVRAGNAPRSDSPRAVTNRIDRAGEDALLTYSRRGPATSRALASQLQGADPATYYEDLPSPESVPGNSGAIGVYADDREFRLRAKADNGEVIEAIGMGEPGEYHLFLPQPPTLPNEPVVNGGFEEVFEEPWTVTSDKVADVTYTDPGFRGSYALEAVFHKDEGDPDGAIVQVIEDLPRRLPGTTYTLTEQVRRTGLTSNVGAGFNFLYRDGSTKYMPATVGTARVGRRQDATGVPSGSSRKWIPLIASGVATEPVAAIEVFALVVGEPVDGAVFVDQVDLSITP
jgi:oligosaccharide repeat unit polymerase